MSDRKTSLGVTLIDLLAIAPEKRTPSEIETISRLTLNYKFFQEILQKEDSSKLQYDCCKVLTVQAYLEDSYVCHKGDEASAFFVILKGSVVVLSCEEQDLDKKSVFGKSQVFDENKSMFEGNDEDLDELNDQVKEKEIAVLYTGQSFGEMALINEHQRYFSVKCLEPTVLGVLHKDDYHALALIHQKMINEKIEFIRDMEAFKNWSKLAVQKLSYFFKIQSYRKSNVVYREGDVPADVFIIKEGEFIFTQTFLIESDYQNERSSFGTLSKKRPEKLFRKKQLKIVVKQKGEIFGYDEIFNNMPTREFTCTCLSKQGELLIISDKNFAKKVVHPETIKYIEDTCNTSKGWTSYRVETLRSIEKVKDSIIHTPYSKLRTYRPKAETPELKLPVLYSPAPLQERKPTILEKFLKHSRNRSNDVRRKKPSESNLLAFQTEIHNKSFDYGHIPRLSSSLGANKQKSFIY